MKKTLRLEFEVDYDLSGNAEDEPAATVEDMADRLADIAHRAFNEGLLTGDSPASVDLINVCVRDLETGELI